MPNRSDSRSSDLSRRDVARLLGAGALTLAFGPSLSFGEDKPTTPATTALTAAGAAQGAGIYHFKLAGGDLDATLVSDGGFAGQPGSFFPTAPKDELEKIAHENFFTLGYLYAHVNTLLLRDGASTILVDTGAGGAFGPTAGKLVSNLARAGVQPADVTHVVITHAHGDHIGGLLDERGQPRFANARVVIGEVEHAFWTGADPAATFKSAGSLLPPEGAAGQVKAAQAALRGVADRIELKKGGETLGKSIKFVEAFGHTPGHMILDINNGDEPFRYIADLLHVLPVQLQHLDWPLLFDTDPKAAAATRQRIVPELVASRALISGAHLPFPTLGHLAADGPASRWVPKVLEW